MNVNQIVSSYRNITKYQISQIPISKNQESLSNTCYKSICAFKEVNNVSYEDLGKKGGLGDNEKLRQSEAICRSPRWLAFGL